ncbi:MAG: aldo/keto reductase [Christensenellales bacterium]|jgi:aryl-alcohol dehydrogenase-like predicted oxidoreductase
MQKIKVYGGVEITPIALGGTLRGVAANIEQQFVLMDKYLAMGGNCIDSARVYGETEGQSDAALGRWLKSRGGREKLVILTKGSHPSREAMHVSRLSKQEIEGDMDASLKAMGVDYSDIHLLHRDDPKIPVEEIMPVLDGLVKSGRTRAIGASNWTGGRIAMANQFAAENGLTPFSISQMHFSLALTTPMQIKDMTQVTMNDVEFGFYRETGMPVLAFGAISRGYFQSIILGRDIKPGAKLAYGYIAQNGRRAKRLAELSDQLGVSPTALLVAYVRDSGIHASALCGFSRESQMDEAFEALTFTLSPAQISYLEGGQ